MLCMRCNKGKLKPALCTFEVAVRDEAVRVRTRGLRCEHCGWETQDIAGAAELARQAADVYRRKHNLLTGEEIRLRRERLNLSQDGFSEWLRVGIASVKRWEGAQVQERAMDELIRLKTDPVALVDEAKVVRARLATARAASKAKRPRPSPKARKRVRSA